MTVLCPECGKTFLSAAGRGSHRRGAHGIAGTIVHANKPSKNGRLATARTRNTLQAILPGGDSDLVGRLARFTVDRDVPRGLVVVGATYGPRLVARQYVGDIVRQAKEPCLVLELGQLAAHRDRIAKQETTP